MMLFFKPLHAYSMQWLCAVAMGQEHCEQQLESLEISTLCACSINENTGRRITSDTNVFWMINASLYGLLQVPGDFIVCSETRCDLNSLTIPVVWSEMDGFTFQCVSINYRNNTQYLGGVIVLHVSPPPQGINGS